MSVVYVVNEGDAPHEDSYAGVVYRFLPRQVVEVPLAVAQELLGHGHGDKTQFLVRLGWCKTSQDLPKAFERLDQFKITDQPPATNRALPPTVGEVTPFPAPGRGRPPKVRAA